MERLDFILPDFVRVSWVSDRAKAVWQPRFRLIAEAWAEIEWLSVVAGIRSCCLLEVTPEQLPHKARTWIKHGLVGLPLEIQGQSNYPYASTPVRPRLMEPFNFLTVVAPPEKILAFQQSFDSGADSTVGQLLGFPDCCNQFFQKTWVEEKFIDTTWSMALNTQTDSENNETSREIKNALEANILWRWMGIRAVPHLPCSFDCQLTISFAKILLTIGRDAGYNSEVEWLLEILDWSVEWSALHGIAEIKTPILKFSTRTDATSEKYVLRLKSKSFPEEGAQGLHFPYHSSSQGRSKLCHH
jgi:hypothetical protein